jgi:hypothetical protein
MQLEPQLADMHADGAIFDDTVVLGLAEDGAADAVFTQILGLAVQRSLREKAQEIPESGRLLEGTGGGDPFDQLPPGICPKIRIHFHHPRLIPSPFDLAQLFAVLYTIRKHRQLDAHDSTSYAREKSPSEAESFPGKAENPLGRFERIA